MQISRRVTNGLAWAGLLLVVGVPSADIISAQVMGESAPSGAQAALVGKPMVIEPATRPRLDEVSVAEAKVAPIPANRPERPQVASVSADPVERYLESNRALPSYISGGETQTAAAEPAETEIASVTPQQTQSGVVPASQAPATMPIETATAEATATPATAAPATADPIDPVEVASIGPDAPASTKVAPVPMPLAMRPAPITRPTVPSTVTQEAVIVIGDDRGPGFPVVPPSDVPSPDGFVSAEDLEDWESGPLSEFLAERSGGPVEPEYDADGFFLDEGPGSSATYRRRPLPPDIVYVYPVN